MKFEINGTKYHIDLFANGYAWVTDKAEALLAFPTELEAYQNALDCEELLSAHKEELEINDNYQNEVFQSFNHRDYR